MSAAFFETARRRSSDGVVDQRVVTAGWYVVYSSVRWPACVSRWNHSVYASSNRLIANSYNNDDHGIGGCRNTSHLLATSFLDAGSVRAVASSPAATRRTAEIRIKLHRLS